MFWVRGGIRPSMEAKPDKSLVFIRLDAAQSSWPLSCCLAVALMTNSRSILVVNSDPVGLHGTVDVLQSRGYVVEGVSCFLDARLRLDAQPPDLLIADVRLGPYNGLHLIVRSRQHLPQMATILTHHHADAGYLNEAAANQAAFLILPCDPAEILKAVEVSLDRRAGAAES